MADAQIKRSWHEEGNSIYQFVSPLVRGIGDIRNRAPTRVSDKGELYLIPGDLRLSDFEDLLGDTWNSAKGGSEASLRVQSAIYRSIESASDKVKADLVLVDLGPNLGALNRAVLAGSQYFITPVAPDLFSIQGTENLGNKLVTWRKDWDQCNKAWKGTMSIPSGSPAYLGYVVQMHNIRAITEEKMRDGLYMVSNWTRQLDEIS